MPEDDDDGVEEVVEVGIIGFTSPPPLTVAGCSRLTVYGEDIARAPPPTPGFVSALGDAYFLFEKSCCWCRAEGDSWS